MAVLYPLMALGLLFAAIPIWLHLRRRDENNLVDFSTLRFLQDQPIARSRPLRPQNWPLLLLRLLALLLLVVAFMWPYFRNADTVIVQESRVYILDNTLSHQVDGLFEAARDKIADDLAKQDIQKQIGVIELTSTARTIVRFGDDPTAAAAAVRKRKPSCERGSFIEAFRQANEMLSNSLGTKRHIVLLSDSQANQWTQENASPPFLRNMSLDLPKIRETFRANRSLSQPRAKRSIRDGKHWVDVAVQFTSRGFNDGTRVVFLNRGREVDRKEVLLTEAQSETEQTRTLFAEWECEPNDWVVGEIQIESNSDALSQDDRVVFSLPPRRTGRVELIARSMYLQRALSPEVMQGRWDVQIETPEQTTEREVGTASDVLCVDTDALSSNSVRAGIRQNLAEGRGVILWVNKPEPLTEGFLLDLGITLEKPTVAAIDSSGFRYLFFEHPLFSPFQTDQFGDLTEIGFNLYRQLRIPNAVPLAFSTLGDPLIFEVNQYQGRMLVFAFSFERNETTWPIHPSFVPFLDMCLSYARGKPAMTTAYEPGASVVWKLQSAASPDKITVSRLDPESLSDASLKQAAIKVEIVEGQAGFQLPGQSGHYAVREGNQRIDAILNVNPSPLESDLVYDGEPKTLLAWQLQGEEEIASNTPAQATGIELSRMEALQQHSWWYLLVTALILFSVELLFSARVSKKN